MYEWKLFKDITTYYNQFLNSKSKYYLILTKNSNGNLQTKIKMDDITFAININHMKSTQITNTFKNMIIPINDFYETKKMIKGIKQLDVKIENDNFVINTDKECEFKIPCKKALFTDCNYEKIGEVNFESLKYALFFNSNSAKSGIAEFDKNISMMIKNNELYLNSYNTGIYVGNKIEIENGKDCSFLISYDYISKLKKWLDYIKKVGESRLIDDTINLLFTNNRLMLTNQFVSIEIPIKIDTTLGEKYKAMTDFNYPKKEDFKFSKIRDLAIESETKKEKITDVKEIFKVESSFYRPLFSGLIKQLVSFDLDVNCSIISSNELVIELNTEILDLKSKILLFGIVSKK